MKRKMDDRGDEHGGDEISEGALLPQHASDEGALVPQHPQHEPLSPVTAMDMSLFSPSNDGRFFTYWIYGKIVQVTTKYMPPVIIIGEGVYGALYSAVKGDTNEYVAIKKIINVFDNKINARKTLGEIKLYRHMNHNNIVKIKDIIPPPEKNNFKDVYIVYERMDTDLHQLLKSTPILSEEKCQYLLCQILRGLKYMHSGNVLHGDLKPSHLLINCSNLDLKICNFGVQIVLNESECSFDFVASRWYRAPEFLLNSSGYSAAIDVWSVGCILMELLDRKPLFPGTDYQNQLLSLFQRLGTPSKAEMEFLKNERAKRHLSSLPIYPRRPLAIDFPHIKPLALDLAEKMLTFDPKRRITVEEALAHPYLAKYHGVNNESISMAPCNYNYYPNSLTVEQAKEFIYLEAAEFNPLYYQRM